MEKYSQFRDRGSGISPFMPTTTPTSTVTLLLHAGIYLCRLPFFLTVTALFFLVFNHLPLPQGARKLFLWTILGIPGIWWVDLQLDGVKRGSLSQQPRNRYPNSRCVVAAQLTSPVDALYLAAIFDPIFTLSYPGTRKVQRVSLLRAVAVALATPVLTPPPPNKARLTTVRALVEENPHRVIAVFPEMTATNGKGVMPFSPSILSAPADAPIFPLSMRYTPPDITTPVPGAWGAFLWNLLSKPTHYIRVRIAESVYTSSSSALAQDEINLKKSESLEVKSEEVEEDDDDDGDEAEREELTPAEQRVLDQVGESLARLARNKRVGLTLRDKIAFVEVWNKGKKKKKK